MLPQCRPLRGLRNVGMTQVMGLTPDVMGLTPDVMGLTPHASAMSPAPRAG